MTEQRYIDVSTLKLPGTKNLHHTNAIGVSFKIVSLLLCTNSGLPDRVTVVTWAGEAPGRLGVVTATSAAIGKGPLVISAQSLERISIFELCTGNFHTGMSSGASSGCVHRRTALAVA